MFTDTIYFTIYYSDGTENIANGTAILESPGRLIVNFAPVPIPGNQKRFYHSKQKKTLLLSLVQANNLTIGYSILITIHLLSYIRVFKLFPDLFTQVCENGF